jgi:hypothetical protein
VATKRNSVGDVGSGGGADGDDNTPPQQQHQSAHRTPGFVTPSSYLRMHASRDVAAKGMPVMGRGSVDMAIADREQWDALVCSMSLFSFLFLFYFAVKNSS